MNRRSFLSALLSSAAVIAVVRPVEVMAFPTKTNLSWRTYYGGSFTPGLRFSSGPDVVAWLPVPEAVGYKVVSVARAGAGAMA